MVPAALDSMVDSIYRGVDLATQNGGVEALIGAFTTIAIWLFAKLLKKKP